MARSYHHSDSGGKKKFGKNLNKQLKASAAPPIASPTSKSSSSRNGLLLLSTNKRSSSGGLLSSKTRVAAVPSSPPVNNARSESFASTHEALVDAVSGTPRGDSQQQPAWSSEKESGLNGNDNGSVVEAEPTMEETVPPPESFPTSPFEPPTMEDQVEYMSRLAREKAEERRKEEQALEEERAAGAARRLRDLEEKLLAPEPPRQRTLWVPDDEVVNQPTAEAPVQRTLWEPPTEEKLTPRGSEAKKGTGKNGSTPEEKSSPKAVSATPPADSMPDGPVIHLNSYEDRNRGEPRNGSAGPRMLFDPKSGSMVEFRQETPRTNGNRRAKTRGKNGVNDVAEGRGRKGKQGRKDDAPGGRKKRGDGPSPKTDTKLVRKTRNAEQRLPRTLGVLYVRDKKGSAPYCADGCDGDLGYGSHSVRGGRIRNPVAHTKFLQAKQQQQQFSYTGFDKSQGYSLQEANGSATGYGRGYAEEKPQEVPLVKGDEKIELLTGAPESPTLKATAMEWAPSGAALAAAIAQSNGGGSSVKSESMATAQQTDEEEEDDSDPMDFIGLGFDPTQNMADVMQSPALKKETSQLEGVDLSKLALEGTPAKNIFSSYSTSSTWGASGTNSSNDTWGGMLGKSPAATTAKADGSPFLSLTTQSNNTWGGGLAGFSTTVLPQEGVSGD